VIEEYLSLKQSQTLTTSPSGTNEETYSALDSGEIRVLELHPGRFEDALRGCLHVVSVDFEYKNRRRTNHAISLNQKRAVWYTALSYVWGSPQFDVKFHTADGNEILITKSLSCALQHLRAESESVWLWIDQLCINQADTREKEQQIPLMGLIYRHATNTVIWLGEEGGDDPAIAFTTLHRVFSSLQFSAREFTPKDFKQLVLPEAEDVAWYEVRQLFRRPWFKRLWVIQEAMLSVDLHVKCGKSTVAWDDLAGWCGSMEYSGFLRWLETDTEVDSMHSQEKEGLQPPLGGSVIMELQKERYLFSVNESAGLTRILSVLVSTRYAQSYEPKDKIYGVLAIAPNHISPDYSNNVSARQVYMEACLPMIPKSLFSLLCCVDHETPLKPSWIPDWSSPRVTESLGHSTKSWALYQAGGPKFHPETGMAFPFDYHLSDDKTTLTLPGKDFDSISSLGPILSNPVLDIDHPTEGNKIWVTWAEMANSYRSYPSDCTVFDAFWQTLVAGKDDLGNAKAPAEYSEAFSLVLDSATGKMPSLPGQTYSPRRQKGFFTLDNLRSRRPRKTLEDLRKSFAIATQNRRFAITAKGYFALVPRGAVAGDRICAFETGHVPFVIRQSKSGEREGFELLGECYVHGVMGGEVMQVQDAPLTAINLV